MGSIINPIVLSEYRWGRVQYSDEGGAVTLPRDNLGLFLVGVSVVTEKPLLRR